MKLLLDENIPHDFRHFLPGHEVVTVAYLGWSGVSNGALLRRAADTGFHALLTMDSGMSAEQNLETIPLSVVILQAKTSTLDDLRLLVPDLVRVLESLPPRTLARVRRS